MLHHPFFGNGQKRQRELHLGSGCAGYDARFRGDQHVICPVYLLRYRLAMCHRIRPPNLYQVEYR